MREQSTSPMAFVMQHLFQRERSQKNDVSGNAAKPDPNRNLLGDARRISAQAARRMGRRQPAWRADRLFYRGTVVRRRRRSLPGRSSTPRRRLTAEVSGILDHPLSRVTTTTQFGFHGDIKRKFV